MKRVSIIFIVGLIALAIILIENKTLENGANKLAVGQVWCRPLGGYHEGDPFNPPEKECRRITGLSGNWVQYSHLSYANYSLTRQDFLRQYPEKEN